MIERLKNKGNVPAYASLGLAIAAGAVALLRNNTDMSLYPHKPVSGEGGLIKYEGSDAQVIYFQDGTRDLEEFDHKGNIVRIYHERCKSVFLGGRFLQIDETIPTTPQNSSGSGEELVLGITEQSPICDNGDITPSDFRGNEARVDTYN